jgi:hypothetical protein
MSDRMVPDRVRAFIREIERSLAGTGCRVVSEYWPSQHALGVVVEAPCNCLSGFRFVDFSKPSLANALVRVRQHYEADMAAEAVANG